jgi:putative transposase
MAAVTAAIVSRSPPAGCVHHSDGGRGNPYGNAKAERFLKTLKVEAVCRMAFESHEDVADHLPRFIEGVYDMRRLYSAPGSLSPVQFEDQRGRATVNVAA